MLYYCFVADCYVDTLEFKDNEIVMTWEDDSKLSSLALKYKKYMDLSSTQNILTFISERVADIRRPNVAPFLAMVDCHLNSSQVEIFLASNGVSINDLFWISKTKDNSYWQDLRKV